MIIKAAKLFSATLIVALFGVFVAQTVHGDAQLCTAQAAEFHKLRDAKRKTNNWNSPLHMAMQKIERCISKQALKTETVVKLLGVPDELSRRRDKLFKQVDFATPGLVANLDQILVYWWRKNSDFLYFGFDGDTMKASGWWHAYE